MSPNQSGAGGQRRLSARHYEILVRGPIGPAMLGAFPMLTARRRGSNTCLAGSLADGAALYGLIHQLEALGLELLELRSELLP